ncbi:hypothetical protein LZ016_07865 [Sphingomonas sp. SM33]|uniref:Uncharacterized protein n=1 Tax=Sphingomonas telluris TaxID=2907998 RepID=A0ABS9VNC6_9SPHN|nr:hypothetical protein [Sphingomonas telluris]MCH8616014.1 hypothetical protein [Sphingomonas telluris]
MSTDPDKPTDADIEQEIRRNRKFSAEEALGRMAGPGAMKGASALSPQQQAENAVGDWLRHNVADTAGALRTVMHRHVNASDALQKDPEHPLLALAGYCRRVLASDDLLKEVVREADVEWGRAMDERPFFEREGAAPHPDDPYTLQSVRSVLAEALRRLEP